MTRQQTRPEAADQRTLTDSIDETTADCNAADSVPETQAALLDQVRVHVVGDVSIDYQQAAASKRNKRRQVTA
ncbi:hypothetical protein DMJ13_19810 [halophilic archaeon]|nr:hypothetical protein DMJ13_19810 [halophilic archaeon]